MRKLKCWDCKKEIKEGEEVKYENTEFVKCKKCFKNDKTLRNFKPIEVYSRIVGYYAPTRQWNPAKVEEFKDRKVFKI